MKNKIIGIAGSLRYDSRPYFLGDGYDYNNNNYSKSIVKAGGTPIYLPVINDEKVIDSYINICDGLLLPGGDDINPLLYNASPQALMGHFVTEVDNFQINLAKKFLLSNKPMLGICRGMQILNVATGGTLYQDLSYANNNHILHNHNGLLSEPCHSINIMEGSAIEKIFGNSYIINSGHHQSVKDLGTGFSITAIAEDNIIEAIEMCDKNFIVGVQWHPEMVALKDDNMLEVFKHFINACM